MSRRRSSYVDFDVCSVSSSTSTDTEDSWYDRNHHLRLPVLHTPHHHGHHNDYPHRGNNGEHPIRVYAPQGPPAAPVAPVIVENQPRGRHERPGGQRARSLGHQHYERDIFLGGRSTAPSLHLNIHNRNSDNDHDHSHIRENEGLGVGARSVFGSQQLPAPVPFAPTYMPGYAPAYGGGISDARAHVNDRMTLDHGEVMNQQVYVHPGRGEMYDGRRHHRHYHDDGVLNPVNDETTHVQKNAVDEYVHQLRVASDAKDAAVRQAKLDWKDHANEIEEAGSKAVNKFKENLTEKKKECEIAVFDYKKEQAEKKDEFDTAKKKWEADKAKAEQDEKDKKKKWEVEQEKKKQEDEEEEKRLKEKWKADEEKKKKEKEDAEKEIKTRLEKDLYKAGVPPRVVEPVLDPKAAIPRTPHPPLYEDTWSRPYGVFEPWDEGGTRYIRVHRRYVLPDTLRVYDLPWEWDRNDTDYIIIRVPYDNPGMDLRILIEHSRKHGLGFSRKPRYEVEVPSWGRPRLRREHRRHSWNLWS